MDVDQDKLRLLIVGANHRSSAAATRDRLFVDEDGHEAFLRRLREAGLSQALLLSTCARVEVQAADADPAAAARSVVRLLAQSSGLAEDELAPQMYTKEGEEAVRHIFSVASSLDSPVVGEPQVTGQIKESHAVAKAAGMTGQELESVLQAAYGTAKRVRSETDIGERPVSMAAAALQVARDVHGDLDRAAALLVAGGDMGELVVEQLLAAGLSRLMVTARVPARAQLAARRWSCHHAAIAGLAELLADADIVVTSLGSGEHTITAAMVKAALATRRRRPMLVVDAGVPGDVQPGVNDLDGAFLYDLDDLERVAETGRAQRDAAAEVARRIVDEEVASYMRGRAARGAVPAITVLRSHFETLRRSVLAEARGADGDEITRRLVNRLLHDPSRALAELAEAGAGGEAERLLRRLFALGPEPPAGDPEGDED